MNSLIHNFPYIDNLISFGQYDEILTILQQWENSAISHIEHMTIQILYAKLYNTTAKYQLTQKITNELLLESQDLNSLYFIFYAIIEKLRALECLNKIEDAFTLIQQGDMILPQIQNIQKKKHRHFNQIENVRNIINVPKNETSSTKKGLQLPDYDLLKAHYYLRCGTIYQKDNQYQKSLKCHHHSFSLFKKKKYLFGIAEVLYNFGLVCSLTNDFVLSKFYFNQSLKISKNYQDNMITAWALLHQAMALYQNGKKQGILDAIQESLRISLFFQNNHSEDYAYNIAAIYYAQMENIKLALKYQKLSYNLRKQRKNQLEINYSLNCIAHYYNIMGNIEKAYQIMQKVNFDSIQIKDNLALSQFYSTKGEILAERGNFSESIPEFQNAISIFENNTEFNRRLRCFHFLIWIHIMQNNENAANKILKKLEELAKVHQKNKVIQLYCLLEKAIIYKNSHDTDKESLARKIFEDLYHISFFHLEITPEVKINYLENYIKEYNLAPNEESLDKILEIMNDLFEVAKKIDKVTLICELLCLKAKISINSNKIDLASNYYIKAQQKAAENGFSFLAQKISHEFDKDLNKRNNSSLNKDTQSPKFTLNFKFCFSKITRNLQDLFSNTN